ncbi:hypothetical protein F3157_13415 [Virgibacillus dakarensis]|nr:hypothetical protein [Virgibacillus dakarensis]
MSIQHITSPAKSDVHHTKQVLRQGQIIQGKVLHLYPNNKAQIQIGTQKMIAQLEASLTIGETYHFQVQATDDIIRLKVLGDKVKSNMTDNVMNLLKQLGLKATKQNKALIQILMTEKIPFDKEQITKAFQLIDNTENKIPARQVIKEIIATKLPLTDSIFQALYTKSTSGFSERINALLLQLKQDTNMALQQLSLIERLTALTDGTNRQNVLVKHIITEVNRNSPTFFQFAKAAGFLDTTVNFATWKAEWTGFEKQYNNGKGLSLPFHLDDGSILRMLEQSNSRRFGKVVQPFLQKWTDAIHQALQKNKPLTQNEFTVLKQEINEIVLPSLTDKQARHIKQPVQNNPESLRTFLSFLTAASTDQLDPKLELLLTNMIRNRYVTLSNPREQFLTQIRQVLQFTGLDYENQLVTKDQTMTVKAMLLQLLHNSDGITHERAQQLLHFINGLQLNSVHESANFIQASLLLPGEKLGLNQDLQLEFAGKKTETGEISADYCRVLFYLDLAHLNETVIDMNVQKRSVAITIYNDHSALNAQTNALKPMLKAGLEKLDYHLSTVSVKPLSQKEKAKANSSFYSTQGVDFRI